MDIQKQIEYWRSGASEEMYEWLSQQLCES